MRFNTKILNLDKEDFRNEKQNKRILAAVMAAGMTLSVIPSITTYAAQSNEYVDPADVWIEANGRTSEFDINATVTTGTMFCPVCDMPTSNISYRVPEYTRTGETAYNRGRLLFGRYAY